MISQESPKTIRRDLVAEWVVVEKWLIRFWNPLIMGIFSARLKNLHKLCWGTESLIKLEGLPGISRAMKCHSTGIIRPCLKIREIAYHTIVPNY